MPGLLLQFAIVIGGPLEHLGMNPQVIGTILAISYILGTVLLFVGLAYYAKSKGRHPMWALSALCCAG